VQGLIQGQARGGNLPTSGIQDIIKRNAKRRDLIFKDAAARLGFDGGSPAIWTGQQRDGFINIQTTAKGVAEPDGRSERDVAQAMR
jgi:hypothetical protein